MCYKNKADHSISRKIFRNTAFNITGKTFQIAVAVFLTPYIIHRIGVDRYGILAILSALTAYSGLFYLGISESFGKFIAEFYALNNNKEIGKVLGSGFVFYGVVGILLVTSVFLSLPFLMKFLRIPPYLAQDAYIVFMVGIIIFVVTSMFSVFDAVQFGLQRMGSANLIGIISAICNAIGSVFVLRKGYGIPGLMINSAIVCAINSLLNFIAAYLAMPNVVINHIIFNMDMFKRLFNFGYKMQIVRIGSIVSTQIGKIIIAAFLSIEMVTFYQLGFNIVLFTGSIAGLVTSILIPVFINILIKDGENALIKAYLKTIKYITFIAVPLFVFILLASTNIIIFWMNQPIKLATLSIQILSIGWMFYTISYVAGAMCAAINKPILMAEAAVIMVALNVLLSVIFVKIFGFFGAVSGGAIATGIAAIYFIFKLHGKLKIPWEKFISFVFPCILTAVFSAFITYAVMRFFPWYTQEADRFRQFIILCTMGFIFTLNYLISAYVIKFLTFEDIVYFKKIFFYKNYAS